MNDRLAVRGDVRLVVGGVLVSSVDRVGQRSNDADEGLTQRSLLALQVGDAWRTMVNSAR